MMHPVRSCMYPKRLLPVYFHKNTVHVRCVKVMLILPVLQGGKRLAK